MDARGVDFAAGAPDGPAGVGEGAVTGGFSHAASNTMIANQCPILIRTSLNDEATRRGLADGLDNEWVEDALPPRVLS